MGCDGLVDCSGLYIIQTIAADHFSNCRLYGFVYCQLWSGFYIYLYIMLFLVDGAHLIRDVVDRSRDEIQIVQHQGGCKHDIQFYRSASECIISLRGQHGNRFLYGKIFKGSRLVVRHE